MKALKLMIALALTITASASFADSACNQQVNAKMFDNTAKKYTAATKVNSMTPASKAKAAKGINDRG